MCMACDHNVQLQSHEDFSLQVTVWTAPVHFMLQLTGMLLYSAKMMMLTVLVSSSRQYAEAHFPGWHHHHLLLNLPAERHRGNIGQVHLLKVCIQYTLRRIQIFITDVHLILFFNLLALFATQIVNYVFLTPTCTYTISRALLFVEKYCPYLSDQSVSAC